ncbi:pilus assembly protein PilP [Acidithiobacillus sulfuriphilus]|uniref:Pilus assembly protein PilP n=2 Tax=Acidithiobacillus sulfuriphilus TaxID=1867749 RepID=A0A3M8RWR2_9PROT|nr:pilus assembly protein PilP [Acidithiobacillus sulfuriphilus]RNF72406.1 pilus assembly protein PilP [Acidithiobacillus sulfuriphilus]
MKKFARSVLVISTLTLLAGCQHSDNLSDLRQFVASGPKFNTHITPLPATQVYHAAAYVGESGRDPFTSFSELRLRQLAAQASKGPRPQAHGPLQPLERFDLSGLKINGIVRDAQGHLWAVIQAPDQKIYRATIGSYVGKNDGRIVSIDDQPGKRSVTVEEYIPNAFGGFQKQQTVMHMQSGT